MRIMHAVDHLERYNGMVHAAVDLACQQASDGHVVSVWSGGGELEETLAASGVALFTAPARPSLATLPSSVLSQSRAIAAFKPDIIHAHMARSALLTRVLSRLNGIALITSVQNASAVGSVCMTVGDGMITGCEAVRDRMARRGVPARKLRAVLNGTIGAARLATTTETAISLERPALLTICGLHRRKGVDILIEAFAMCQQRAPDSHLYIIGDGPARNAYEKVVADLDLRNVHFCGYIADTRPYMAAADAFVLASRADPAPLVIAEAREAGLAIVATDVDGIPEMLEYGRAGLLVKSNSAKDLAGKLMHLLGTDGALDLWRQRSRHAIERLSIARVAAETTRFYEEFVRAEQVVPVSSVLESTCATERRLPKG